MFSLHTILDSIRILIFKLAERRLLLSLSCYDKNFAAKFAFLKETLKILLFDGKSLTLLNKNIHFLI
jgi:hypothetical protein